MYVFIDINYTRIHYFSPFHFILDDLIRLRKEFKIKINLKRWSSQVKSR